MQEEIWKDVKGFENLYEVSNFGNVKSLKQEGNSNGRKYAKKERILNAYIDGTGYPSVTLYKNGKRFPKRIHVLLAVAFLNHTSCGLELVVDHIDNNPLNNDLSNLQLITHRENTSKDKKGFAGVNYIRGTWMAHISFKGKTYYLGSFKTEEEAKEVYTKSLNDYNNDDFNHKRYNTFSPSSKLKGVAWHKGNGKWQVNKTINGKTHYIGYFDCELEASEAYQKELSRINNKQK